MRLLLTEQEAREAIAAIANGIRRDDGFVQVDLSFLAISHSSSQRPTLTLSPDSRTVRCGKRSARLSGRLYALLCLLCDNDGKVGVEVAQDAVWRKEVSDSLIRQTCSNLSEKLFNSNIPYAVVTRRGQILLESANEF